MGTGDSGQGDPEAITPHSLALVLVGAGLLWVGWFGAVPLRRDGDEEREGLDLSDHGERAYNP